jgi:hypothetical protein
MSITETFFPALMQACSEDPNGIQDLKLKCGICHENMTVEEEDSIDNSDDEASINRRAFIVPCMRIFCNECAVVFVKYNTVSS